MRSHALVPDAQVPAVCRPGPKNSQARRALGVGRVRVRPVTGVHAHIRLTPRTAGLPGSDARLTMYAGKRITQ